MLLFDMNPIPNEEGCVPSAKGCCVPTPKCCVLTEFLPKRGVLSSTLTDQGWTHNPNVTPGSYPTFWGLFGMVPIAHTTQQYLLIGLFAKSDGSHW